MMKWIVVCCIVLSGPVLAQQINVRSGAHESFTRLVLDVPAGTNWTLDSQPGGALLRLEGHTDGFDTSSVFDRIDRTFISSIVSEGANLKVAFSCNCSARVFTEGAGMIVMDVSAASGADAPVTRGNSAFAFVGQRPLRFSTGVQNVAQQDLRDARTESATESEAVSDAFQANTLRSAEIDEIGLVSDTERLREAQSNLSRRIGAAATRGILNPSNPMIDFDIISPQPHIDTRIFDSSGPGPEQPQGLEPVSGNIRITSSSDTEDSDTGKPLTSTSMGIACIDPALIAVQDWGSDIGLSREVATLRGQLFGEFDRLDHDIAIRLVQIYLHYGFGPEAQQILSLDHTLMQAQPALTSVSEIMEFGHSRSTNYLQHFVDCDSAAALWSILSIPDIDPSLKINTQSALLSLSGLPLHLRNFIAPELSRRLLAYGDEDGAAAALRSLERTPEPLSPRANLAKANLEMAQGDVAQAQGRLSEVVASNAEQSAEALIKFVDSHLEEDAEIGEDVATLVEAYALEMRDSPIGDELKRTHVLALGKSGQFYAAFEALSRVRARNADMSEDVLRSSVLDLLTRNASDVEFLDHAFTQMAIAPETIIPKTRFHLAKRLVGLGFHAQSEIVLSAGSEYPDSAQTALLRAEISLALDRPQEALAHLFGDTSEAAAILRAQAETLSGDYSEAHSIYTTIGDETNSRLAAWMSDDWSVLVEEAAPVLGPVVRVAQSTLDNPPELEGMLERTETAILESQEARQVIEALLNSNSSDEDSN